MITNNILLKIMFTLGVSFLFGFLIKKMKLPGAMMLGGMVGAALLNILFAMAYLPPKTKMLAQSLAGGFLGCSISRKDLHNFKRLLLPCVLALMCMTTSNLLIGFVVTKISSIDSTTALVSGIAGGINNIPLIADDLGADTATVTILQFLRLFVGIGVFPGVIRLTSKDYLSDEGEETTQIEEKKEEAKPIGIVLALFTALLGGYVGSLTGIPAGTLLLSLLFTGALKMFFDICVIPKSIKPFAQLISGAYIGCLITRNDVLGLKYLVVPAFAVILIYLLDCFVFSKLISRFCGYTTRESMLACTPAGASEMVLISSDLNVPPAKSADLAIIHIARVIVSVSLMPLIIPYISVFF